MTRLLKLSHSVNKNDEARGERTPSRAGGLLFRFSVSVSGYLEMAAVVGQSRAEEGGRTLGHTFLENNEFRGQRHQPR